MCNAWNHEPGCKCGWGGEGATGGGVQAPLSPQISHPPPGTRSVWQHGESDFCAPSKCPRCGDAVFFVRHNGGSVWLNPPLGPPWPKHPCFDTSTSSYATLHILASRTSQFPNMLFGIIVETIVDIPGLSGRVIVKCSDGTTLDEEVDSTVQFVKIVGSIIGVERTLDGVRFHLFPSTSRNKIGSKPVIPVWVEECICRLDDIKPSVRNAAIAMLIKVRPNDLPAIFGILSAIQHKSFLVRVGIEEVINTIAPQVVSMLLLILRIPGCGHLAKIAQPYINRAGMQAKRELAEIKRMRSRSTSTTNTPKSQHIATVAYQSCVKTSEFVKCGYCGVKVKRTRLAKHLAKAHPRQS